MSEDRHINFKLMRERILALQSEPPALAGGLSAGADPPADAGGSDRSRLGTKYWRSLEELADASRVP